MDVSCIAPNLPINFFFFLMYLFLALLGLHCCEQTLVAASRGYPPLVVHGFSLRWLLLLWSTGLLVALQHVESSQTRDQTDVPLMARWILKVVCPGPPGKPSPPTPLIPVLSQIRPSPYTSTRAASSCRGNAAGGRSHCASQPLGAVGKPGSA